MDVFFMALAEGVVSRVEDRYGRVAAVVAAVIMIALPIAIVIAAIAWFVA